MSTVNFCQLSTFGQVFNAGGHVIVSELISYRVKHIVTNRYFLLLFIITLGLELSDTNVYEPQIRALPGTVSHYCQAVVLKSRTVPSGTALLT